jgi:hypothetical protein
MDTGFLLRDPESGGAGEAISHRSHVVASWSKAALDRRLCQKKSLCLFG